MGTITHIKSEYMGKVYSNLTIYKAQTTKAMKALRLSITDLQETIEEQEKRDWRKIAYYLGEPAKPQLRALRIELNELKAERARIIDPKKHEQAFNDAKVNNQDLGTKQFPTVCLNDADSEIFRTKHSIQPDVDPIIIGRLQVLGYCIIEGFDNSNQDFRVTAQCMRKTPYKFILQPLS